MQEGQEVRQKNEGKWLFSLQDSTDGSAVELDVEIGRYMDTSLVRADVQPLLVRLLIKVWHASTASSGFLDYGETSPTTANAQPQASPYGTCTHVARCPWHPLL